MDFKNFLNEAGIVDTIKAELPALEGEVSKHIATNPNSAASTLLNSLKTAIASNHAGDIKVAKERLDKLLHPDLSLNVPTAKPTENHDLNTQLGTYKIQVYEIKNLLGSEVNPTFNEIQEKFNSVSSDANEIKKLNNQLRSLRNSINQNRKGVKAPELFPAPGRTEKQLTKSGILNPDGTVNKDAEGNMIVPEKPKSTAPLTGIDKFVAKLKKGLGTDKPADSVEPAPEVSTEPRMSVSDIGKTKSTSLVAQEKLLDDNKATIPLDMYQMAKNAIKAANSSNDPEDIKIAEEMINNALENA